MDITSIAFYHYQQWGQRTWTFDVITGRVPTLASAALSNVINGSSGHTAVGITRYKTRNTPVSQDVTVQTGQYYWQWAPVIYNHTMTEITFAMATSDGEQLTGQFQLTFYAF